jgi:hypothetical protein
MASPAGRGSARLGPDTPLGHSAEGEDEGLHARVEELDVELPVGDGTALTDQLVEPLLVERAVALLVDVDAMCRAGRSPIDEHSEPGIGVG